MTPLSSAANMHSLHPEASTHAPLRAVRFCALANPYGYYRRLLCSRCGAHTSTFLPPVPRRCFAFSAFHGLWPLRYHEGSDSCTAHLPCRSPHLLRHTFLSFRLQPRGLPDHRLPPRQRDQRVSDFAMNEQARRSSPPNRVRYPTDRRFASGCSPPRLGADAVTFGYGVCGFLRHGLSPCCCGAFMGALIPAHAGIQVCLRLN